MPAAGCAHELKGQTSRFDKELRQQVGKVNPGTKSAEGRVVPLEQTPSLVDCYRTDQVRTARAGNVAGTPTAAQKAGCTCAGQVQNASLYVSNWSRAEIAPDTPLPNCR